MLQVLPPCSRCGARPSFKPGGEIFVFMCWKSRLRRVTVSAQAVTVTQLLGCNLVAYLYTKKKSKFHSSVVEWCLTYMDS